MKGALTTDRIKFVCCDEMFSTGVVGLYLIQGGRWYDASIAVIFEQRVEYNRLARTVATPVRFHIYRYGTRCTKPTTQRFTTIVTYRYLFF